MGAKSVTVGAGKNKTTYYRVGAVVDVTLDFTDVTAEQVLKICAGQIATRLAVTKEIPDRIKVAEFLAEARKGGGTRKSAADIQAEFSQLLARIEPAKLAGVVTKAATLSGDALAAFVAELATTYPAKA
jgi:hypothetical protein